MKPFHRLNCNQSTRTGYEKLFCRSTCCELVPTESPLPLSWWLNLQLVQVHMRSWGKNISSRCGGALTLLSLEFRSFSAVRAYPCCWPPPHVASTLYPVTRRGATKDFESSLASNHVEGTLLESVWCGIIFCFGTWHLNLYQSLVTMRKIKLDAMRLTFT